MTVKDLVIIIGLITAIGGPLIQYGRLTERQEKNDILLGAHERHMNATDDKVSAMREDDNVKVQLVRLNEQMRSLSEKVDELKARRR